MNIWFKTSSADWLDTWCMIIEKGTFLIISMNRYLFFFFSAKNRAETMADATKAHSNVIGQYNLDYRWTTNTSGAKVFVPCLQILRSYADFSLERLLKTKPERITSKHKHACMSTWCMNVNFYSYVMFIRWKISVLCLMLVAQLWLL